MQDNEYPQGYIFQTECRRCRPGGIFLGPRISSYPGIHLSPDLSQKQRGLGFSHRPGSFHPDPGDFSFSLDCQLSDPDPGKKKNHCAVSSPGILLLHPGLWGFPIFYKRYGHDFTGFFYFLSDLFPLPGHDPSGLASFSGENLFRKEKRPRAGHHVSFPEHGQTGLKSFDS